MHMTIADLRDREEGQGLVEYVVVIALVALLIFGVLPVYFTGILGGVYSLIADILDDNVRTRDRTSKRHRNLLLAPSPRRPDTPSSGRRGLLQGGV